MAAPFPLPDRCDIYRPLGAAAPLYTDVPCRHVPSLWRGEVVSEGTNEPSWQAGIDVESGVDIRDASFRTGGVSYQRFNDGDEVRLTLAGSTFVYVVSWVEVRYSNTPAEYKRAYLTRDAVTW